MLINGIEHTLVQNGLFAVSRDGDSIYRGSRNGYAKATVFRASSKLKYKTVTAMINGAQKHFYVHRLVAEAYIPNPHGYPQVLFRDYDPSNTNTENLMWGTASHNSQRSVNAGRHRTSATHGHPCSSCGEPTLHNDLCGRCRAKEKYRRKSAVVAARKESRIREDLQTIDLDSLNDKDRTIIQMRMGAKTYTEIGNVFGVSKQAIEYKIHNIVLRAARNRTKDAQRMANEELRHFLKKRCISFSAMARTTGIAYQHLRCVLYGSCKFTDQEIARINGFLNAELAAADIPVLLKGGTQ